jgi:hypothetical protein
MENRARSIGALVLGVGWFCVPSLADAQLPDIGGGSGGDSGSGGISLPDVGNPSGDVGSAVQGDLGGALGGTTGGGSVGGAPLLPGPGIVVIDHSAAVKAVQDHHAMPLNDLLKRVTESYRGRVIDVQLVRAAAGLLYQVKLLDGGTVYLAYFDAATGAPTVL